MKHFRTISSSSERCVQIDGHELTSNSDVDNISPGLSIIID